jgi:long-chain fatty acid transport protein
MGGAYVAISDDPSGIYYNPAGIVFSIENYLSISANAFSSTNQNYANIYPGQSYVYTSQALIPVLFGFTQTVGKGKFGFAVLVPDSEQDDQSDTVTQSDGSRQFTRKYLRQDTTYMAGPAYAWQIRPNLSMGISLFGAVRFVKTVDNTTVLYPPIGTGPYLLYTLGADQTEFGLEPKIGFQYMPIPKLAIGLTFSKMYPIGGSGQLRTQQTNTGPGGTPPVPTGNFNTDYSVLNSTNVFHDFASPLSGSIGAAYFFTKSFLISAQFDAYEGKGDYEDFPIAATFNWSIGAEYYLNESWAVRGGLYSDNANTRNVDPNGTNQAPHVNLIGGSFGLSMYRPGASITLGVTYANGTGPGQAFSDSTLVQQVTQNNLIFFLGGSYQL